MAAKKGVNKTIYFADRAVLTRVDRLAKKLDLKPNRILSTIVERQLARYEQRPLRILDERAAG